MDIETRLQALEKSNRRYRLAFLSLVVVLAAFMLLGSGGQVPDTIQARKFEVLDKNGKILVRLSELDGLGSVTTYTPAGEILVDLVPTKSGAGGIVLYNGKGKQTMVMTDVTGGGGSLLINNSNGDKVLSFGRNTSEGGSITTFNSRGRTGLLMTNDTSHAGAILSYDDSGKETGRFPTN
jgi:hypothetical protein